MKNDISVLLPEPQAVTFGKYTIHVQPIGVKQARRAGSVIALLMADIGDIATLLPAAGGNYAAIAPTVALSVGANVERCIELVEIASGVPAEELDQLPLDEFVELASQLVQINARFFTERLLPALQKSVPTGLLKSLQQELSSSQAAVVPAPATTPA